MVDEIIGADKVVYTIGEGDKQFVVPEEVTHRQYFRIVSMFRELGVNAGELMDTPKIDTESNELDLNFKAGNTLTKLLEAGKIPVFFATLLVPVGSKVWKKEFATEHLEVMEDIGDVTAMEVLRSFLAGRADLIVGLIQFFSNFMSENSQLIEKFNVTSIKTESPEQ